MNKQPTKAEIVEEYNTLRREVTIYLDAPAWLRKKLEEPLRELADYEPSEAEQGLIPIPEGYNEQ